MTECPEPIGDARFFTHLAMNTTFALRFRGIGEQTARGIARECFDLVDSLENRLSRFLDGSEVSQINRLGQGETLYLSEACHRCLLDALGAHAATGGLFDITLGRRTMHWKSGAGDCPPPLEGRLVIHPDVPAVTCEEPGREIDLGGIGKGFALDQLARLLADWEVESALLAAGASSLLAVGTESWNIDLTGDGPMLRVTLAGEALSASGTGIQGSHILHPGGAEFMPGDSPRRVWVTAATAAMAEAWSTAMMLVPASELSAWRADCPAMRRLFAEDSHGIRQIHLATDNP